MKKTNTWLMLLIVAGACTSNSKTSKSAEPTILNVGDEKISTKDFAYVYEKNNTNPDEAYTEKSLREYMELYTNFKLKVNEARSQGLDTTAEFKNELGGYRKQLAQPYMTEKSVTEKLVAQAYERMKEEVNASHILIRVAPEAEPKDTLAAYKKALDIRKKALAGEDFAALARAHSEDPSAASNGGNLGYFTALQMVYPFENAAFGTAVGDISNPVRTRFGYHIIKVHDRRPSQGEVKTAHIMIRASSGLSEQDSLDAKGKIDEIYARLKAGENWNTLTEQFSDDISSKNTGGELPYFGTGGLGLPSFENAAFALQKPGDFSAPLLTPYGWHIIKLIEKKPLASFEELKPTLAQKVNKDSRSELNRTFLIERITKENKIKENTKNIELALAKADSSLLRGEWKRPGEGEAISKMPLFTINDSTYKAAGFFFYAEAYQKPLQGVSPGHAMRRLYDLYREESLIAYEEANLESKYTDFKMLFQEYRDGILLFKLMDEKVWSKAVEDTAGLKTFFEANRDKYKWSERADVMIFDAINEDVLNKAITTYENRPFQVTQPELPAIIFATNSAKLDEKARKELDKVASILTKMPDLQMLVAGNINAKEAKSKKAALALRNARAQAVLEYLLSKEMDTKRISKGGSLAVGQSSVTFTLLSTSAKDLQRMINAENALNLKITEALYARGDNKLLDATPWKSGTYNIDDNGRKAVVIINRILPPDYKTLDECRGHVISDYQNYLEKEWIEELRSKFKVEINESELKGLIKK